PVRDRLRSRRGALAGLPVRQPVVGGVGVSRAVARLGGVGWAEQFNKVGGVAIFGGSGSVVGAALGALLLQTISSALNVLGVASIWTEAIAGFLLLVAITLDRGIQLRLAAALRRRRVHLGA